MKIISTAGNASDCSAPETRKNYSAGRRRELLLRPLYFIKFIDMIRIPLLLFNLEHAGGAFIS